MLALAGFRSYDPIRCQEPQWPRRPLAIGRRGLPLTRPGPPPACHRRLRLSLISADTVLSARTPFLRRGSPSLSRRMRRAPRAQRNRGYPRRPPGSPGRGLCLFRALPAHRAEGPGNPSIHPAISPQGLPGNLLVTASPVSASRAQTVVDLRWTSIPNAVEYFGMGASQPRCGAAAPMALQHHCRSPDPRSRAGAPIFLVPSDWVIVSVGTKTSAYPRDHLHQKMRVDNLPV